MTRRASLALLLAVVVAIASCNGVRVTYTFDDEFNGTTVSSLWGDHWGPFGGDGNTWSRSQSTVAIGVLTIAAQRAGSAWVSDAFDTWATWRQKYGYFEARIRIPKGRGLWPAFWLAQGSEVSGPAEIDVMEVCANPLGTNGGNDASVLHTSVHFSGGGSLTHDTRTPDLSSDWHVYAMDWRADHISFLLDGAEVWRVTDPAHIPAVAMPLILDLAVGGSCGAADDSTPDPALMQVDWVRVSP